jgi:hypothetical protein
MFPASADSSQLGPSSSILSAFIINRRKNAYRGPIYVSPRWIVR